MVGLSREQLVKLLLIQTSFFAIPGWVFGLLVAEAVFIGASFYLQSLTAYNVNKSLNPTSFGVATVLGFAVPLGWFTSSIFTNLTSYKSKPELFSP